MSSVAVLMHLNYSTNDLIKTTVYMKTFYVHSVHIVYLNHF